MTSIRIDGQDKGPPQVGQHTQPTQLYSIPLNTTSAINVHLMHQQQQQQMRQLAPPVASSASTYVYITPQEKRNETNPSETNRVQAMSTQTFPVHEVYAQANHVQSVPVQTVPVQGAPIGGITVQGAPVYGVPVQDMPVQSVPVQVHLPQDYATNVQADYSSTGPVKINVNGSGYSGAGIHPYQRTVSEPDSARGSLPDDNMSLNSSGSRGTESNLDDFAKVMSSMNLGSSSNDAPASPESGGQQEFTYVQNHSLTESWDSQLGNSFGSGPVSPCSPTEEKQVRFQKKWPLSWDDEDTGSENSLEAKYSDASSFILDDFTEEESKTVEDAEALKATRVALYRGEEMTAMLKVKCGSEEMGYDLRVINLLEDILQTCDLRSKKMKGGAVRLTPYHLNKMCLSDGRPAKERAAEVARVLQGDLILCEAVCQKHADRIHIATDIRDTVYQKGALAVGKHGILVALWKKHKYAVAREFSEPLCNHIHFYKPHLLGNTSETTLKRKRKATDTVRRVLQSPALLSQMFKTDPTITVAEAARRSFVEVIFYGLYE